VGSFPKKKKRPKLYFDAIGFSERPKTFVGSFPKKKKRPKLYFDPSYAKQLIFF